MSWAMELGLRPRPFGQHKPHKQRRALCVVYVPLDPSLSMAVFNFDFIVTVKTRKIIAVKVA